MRKIKTLLFKFYSVYFGVVKKNIRENFLDLKLEEKGKKILLNFQPPFKPKTIE